MSAVSAMALLTPSPAATTATGKKTLRGVVWDMDGTLTVPNLDFDLMYRRAGVDKSEDILEAIAKMTDADAAARANAIIEDMEREARDNLKLLPGAAEVQTWLSYHHNLPTALVTRNTHASAKVLQRLLSEASASSSSMSPVICRDTQGVPHKPHPAALKYISKEWSNIDEQGISEDLSDLVMVGDSLSNDVGFGQAAGATTVWLDTPGGHSLWYGGSHEKKISDESESSPIRPDISISHLIDLPKLLCQKFDIPGPLGTHRQFPKVPPPEPESVATKAARDGDISTLEGLSSADLVAQDETWSNTPLIWAAEANQLSAVRYLLGRIGDDGINTQGYLGATALCRAARRGHVEVLRYLLDAGADANIPNEKLQYPLHFTAFKRQHEAVKILIGRPDQVNVFVLDRKGRTPADDTDNEEIRGWLHEAMRKKGEGI